MRWKKESIVLCCALRDGCWHSHSNIFLKTSCSEGREVARHVGNGGLGMLVIHEAMPGITAAVLFPTLIPWTPPQFWWLLQRWQRRRQSHCILLLPKGEGRVNSYYGFCSVPMPMSEPCFFCSPLLFCLRFIHLIVQRSGVLSWSTFKILGRISLTVNCNMLS